MRVWGGELGLLLVCISIHRVGQGLHAAAQIEGELCAQVLPVSRVKRLIKQQGTVKAVSAEASFAIARATVRLC